jgi:hypothetical protein
MIDDGRTALLTGMTIGVMMSVGLDVRPEVDENGDYKASIILELPEPALPGTKVRLTVEGVAR